MVFHDASEYCYDWLKKQPFVKEESLTDWILYNVSEHNSNVYYKAFTRNEESKNGVDWEWWILTDGYSSARAYRFLVQAKKLKDGGRDNYPLVTYSNSNGFQLDLLIEEAKTRRALPLYAYYSCCCPDFDEQCRNIDYIADELLGWCDGCVNGCFLTSAFELHKNVFYSPRRKIADRELIDSSFGLSLLDMINKPVALSDFLRGLNNHYNKFNSDSPNETGFMHLYKNLPVYAKALIERKEEKPEWLENQLHREIGNLAGVVIIDAREKKG